jgi:isopropylmalate/homocitrate/citramalate synthase
MYKNRRNCLICDTTLRDGEQMPGVVFSLKEKIDLAKKSVEFGTDTIELMPAVSNTEKTLARELVNAGFDSKITASTAMRKEHIEIALDCNISNITLFTPVSDLHLEHKLKISREENLNRALEMIDYARAHGLKVSFAGEDSTRADIGYLTEFIKAISDRIEYFIPCDTLGCLTPNTTSAFIKRLREDSNTPLCLHVHNDFGLATANTLAGLSAGAEIFSGTFCGIGERAGNTPIEEVCVALKFIEGIDLDVNYHMLTEICNLVELYSRIRLQAHKPVVGENAFTHESGIHADGMIKHHGTYENFEPEIVGQQRRFLFGKHTGKGILKHMMEKYDLRGDIEGILQQIKDHAEFHHNSLTETEVINLIAYEEDKLKTRAQNEDDNKQTPLDLSIKTS